jgi:biopolymer transport protein ExbD
MARKKLVIDESSIEEANMTPMIDVTFQLLIFFMVCTEMRKLDDMEDLHLPKAEHAALDKNPPKERISINILPGPGGEGARYYIGGVEMTLDQIEVILFTESKLMGSKKGDWSERPVLIRGDMEVQYQFIQGIMERCMKKGIYRLSFATAKPEAK